MIQECIPVGCAPPAAVAICLGGCLSQSLPDPPNIPPGSGPRHPPAVGLDTPGCGPGHPPPRVWVWIPPNLPLGLGLDTPLVRPPNLLPGSGPRHPAPPPPL